MTKRPSSSRHGPSGAASRRFSLDRLQFPALAAFFKGYLHEDFPDAHGSARAAAAAFCRDASRDERRQLEGELMALVEAVKGAPATALVRFVTRELGSAWNPRSARDLADLLAVLRAAR